MSLIRFFRRIDRGAFGRFVSRKREQMVNTDPDKIYIENVRSFFGISSRLAKFFCDMAVRENLLIRRIGVLCPNDGNIIEIVDDLNDLPSYLVCETCFHLEREPNEWKSTELRTVTFYQLNRTSYAT